MRRQMMLAEFGDRCSRCGYDRCKQALQFHHADPSEKKEWSGGLGATSLKEVMAHPERFLLLCANCHFEEHERMDAERRVYAPCEHCGKPVQQEAHRIKDNRGKYCSKKCTYEHWVILPSATEETRFWKHVQKTESCWVWTGYSSADGTGMLETRHENGRRSARSVNRISWEIAYGPLRPYVQLIHTCSNSLCVRPDHLRLRTAKSLSVN